MSLNIKSDHVHALARQASQRTGLSQTSVVERALRELLERLPDQSDSERGVDDVLAVIDLQLDDAARARLTTESLYDERGLPA